MSRLIQIAEFEKLYQKNFNKKDFDDIENFILKNSENTQFLRLGSNCNGKFIQAKNYVGVLQTKSGFTLEILPKIAKNSDDIKTSKKIFIKMLKALKNFPFKISNFANLDLKKVSILEIFISMFLDELSSLLKKGIKSDYVNFSDNLNFLKGKLIINRQINKNNIHKNRFYVEYDEFTNDIEINQIIKTTLEFLYKRSSYIKNQQRIRRFLFIFDEVSKHKNYKNFFKHYCINRQTKHYEQALLWCKIFLLKNSFTPYSGDNLAFAFLFDMNRLFENYVGKFIQKNYENVKLQYFKKYLVDSPKSFKLIPDIFIAGESKIIADTKWKTVESPKEISQADLYQLYTYGKKYNCYRLFLIYPKAIDRLEEDHYILKFNDEMILKIIYFDLEVDDKNKELIDSF